MPLLPYHAAWPFDSKALCGADITFISDRPWQHGESRNWCQDCDRLSHTAQTPKGEAETAGRTGPEITP
jgi:hypothetical protein